MALAFELPEHLPRASQASDKSTHILIEVGQSSDQSLNAALAVSWLAGLDAAIRDTKSRISKRIQDDLPAFDRQLGSSVNVRARLDDLSKNVDRLTESLNDSNTGILPNLLRTLSTHSSLAEQASDSTVLHRTLAHLLRTREELGVFSSWVQQGKFPESVEASRRVQSSITKAPSPLDRAEIMVEINKQHRKLNDRVQEQIGDAYARSIAFSSSPGTTSLTILACTRVPPTSMVITLPEIFRCMSPDALLSCQSALRRDIMTKFVEPTLLFSWLLISSTSEGSNTLTLTSSSCSSSPLHSLQILMTFLDSNIFHHLPQTNASFSSTFHVPVTTAILAHLIKPSIPSTLSLLPTFLNTIDDAVRFEEALLPTDVRDRPIQSWADDAAGHYERKRCEDVMQFTRNAVTKQDDGGTIRISVAQNRTQELSDSPDAQGGDTSGWDFDGAASDGDEGMVGVSETGGANSSKQADTQDHGGKSSDMEDPSDGWGWGEDADEDTENTSSPSFIEPPTEGSPSDARDDPWGDDSWDTQSSSPPPPEPQPEAQLEPVPSTSQRTPKLAKRLEKFSAKAKGHSVSSTPVPSPSIPAAPKPPLPPQSQVYSPHKPAPLKPKEPEKETYLISVRVKMVLEAAESLLREGQELIHSDVFSAYRFSKGATPGQLLVTTAPSILDLHRALYPIVHSSTLAHDLGMAMLWANDCKFLSDEVAGLRKNGRLGSAEGKWVETEERFRVFGKVWFDDVVTRQQNVARDILVGAQGFVDVMNALRFEECKNAIEQVLREVTSVAQKWKVTLTKSEYLLATGQIVDDALFRVMDNILSLKDIPEADSERLSELCEMLAPLEELFMDAPGQQSVVGSHVPSWFKFSYLSWLIKGSIADLSYLFDQGMLVDYEIDELVRLLRALFAETPLRESTIAKISRGHPLLAQHGDFE